MSKTHLKQSGDRHNLDTDRDDRKTTNLQLVAGVSWSSQ